MIRTFKKPAIPTQKLPVDDIEVIESGLLIPGKKPIGQVVIDWNHSLARELKHCFIFSHWYGYRDLVSGLMPSTVVNASINSDGLRLDDGHLEYTLPTGHWMNSGVTNWSMAYRTKPDNTGSTSNRSGMNFTVSTGAQKNGSSRYREQIWWYAMDSINREIIDTDSLTAGAWTDIGLRYNGNDATAADRLKGYVDGVEQSDTDSFPSSLYTSHTLLLIGAYIASSTMYDDYETNAYCYMWNRTLSVEELNRVRADPYQFLEPA